MFKLGWPLAVVGTLTTLGILVLLGNVPSSSAGPPPLPIQSASAAALAIQGVSLHKPVAAARVDQASVVSNALNQFRGSKLREVVLADVTDIHTQPNVHCTCWVVSLFPPASMDSRRGGPLPDTVRSPSAYLILFFDSRSGAFVEGIQSGTGG
jgi:hypothetical protein